MKIMKKIFLVLALFISLITYSQQQSAINYHKTGITYNSDTYVVKDGDVYISNTQTSQTPPHADWILAILDPGIITTAVNLIDITVPGFYRILSTVDIGTYQTDIRHTINNNLLTFSGIGFIKPVFVEYKNEFSNKRYTVYDNDFNIVATTIFPNTEIVGFSNFSVNTNWLLQFKDKSPNIASLVGESYFYFIEFEITDSDWVEGAIRIPINVVLPSGEAYDYEISMQQGSTFIRIEGNLARGSTTTLGQDYLTQPWYFKPSGADIAKGKEMGLMRVSTRIRKNIINGIQINNRETNSLNTDYINKNTKPNILLQDTELSHGNAMVGWYEAAYGTFPGTLYNSFTINSNFIPYEHIKRFRDSLDIDLTFGGQSTLNQIYNKDPSQLYIVPNGSNSLIRIDNTRSIDSLRSNVIIVTARDETDNTGLDGTSYGFGVEFNEETRNTDLINAGLPGSGTEDHQQSPSTAIVAAKFKWLRDQTQAPWYVIRKYARETASNANSYNIYRGFGVIDTTAAKTAIITNYTTNISSDLGKYFESISPFNGQLNYSDKGLNTAVTKNDINGIPTIIYDIPTDTYKLPTTLDGQTQNLGQEIFVPCYNDNASGATELNPKLFIVTNVKAGEEFIKLAVLANANDLTQGIVYGINTTSASVGEYFKLLTYGDMSGVNTSSWLVNTILYADLVSGELTDIKPAFNIFPIARVDKSHATDGKLFVNTISAPEAQTTIVTSGFDRVFYTADEIITGTGTYFLSKRNDLGIIASATTTAICADDTQTAVSQQIVGTPIGFPISFPAGTYSGQIEFQVNNTNAEQRIRVEYYIAEADGTPVDSGILTEPVGVLGVRPALRAVSPLYDASANIPTFASIQGVLAQDVPLGATERVRTVIICEKVGTQGGDVTFTVYFGNLHASYTDTPALFQISDNIDVDTSAALTNNILKLNGSGIWQGSTLGEADILDFGTYLTPGVNNIGNTYFLNNASDAAITLESGSATITGGNNVSFTVINDRAIMQNGVGDTSLIFEANGDSSLKLSNSPSVAGQVVGAVDAFNKMGWVDINRFVILEQVGEAVAIGELVYLKTDGKWWLSNAGAEVTSSTELAVVTEVAVADDTIRLIKNGSVTGLSGLTTGKYYLDESNGNITNDTSGFISGSILRYIGTAKSTTELYFNPDQTYFEIF